MIEQIALKLEPSTKLLSKKLQIAFDIFSLNGIHDLFLQIKGKASNHIEQIFLCLEILSKFDQASQSDSEIVFYSNGQQTAIPIIKGHDGQAEPNLTLLAALNNLSLNDMERIKAKITNYIDQQFIAKEKKIEFNIFSVLGRIDSLKDKLIIPPLKVNNKYLTIGKHSFFNDVAIAQNKDKANENGDFMLPGDISIPDKSIPTNFEDNIPVSNKENTTNISDEEILDLTHSITNEKEDRTKDQGMLTNGSEMESLEQADINLKNGKEYLKINECDSDGFARQLQEATEILAMLKSDDNGEEILVGIVQSLKALLNNNQYGSKENVAEGDQKPSLQKTSPEVTEKFHFRLLNLLSPFQERSEKKYKEAIPKKIKFQKVNFKKISRRFELSISDVKEIIETLNSCFDTRGYFIRSEFEMRIPQFIVHEKKVFGVLWEYLNEPLNKHDRIAFLNSLHLLASKMSHPHNVNVVSFLLDDLFHNSQKVSFSDRNAFMLASLLLRNYNKECHVDIELTPGEVLLVKNGLNTETVDFVAARIKSDQRMVEKKLDTIHDRLIKAFGVNAPESFLWEPDFLLSLEREAFIFLSLIAGEPVRQILIPILSEYGNPKSKIYKFPHNDNYLSLLLQQLKLLIRCFGRVGDIEDLGFLADLKRNKNQFIELSPSSQHERNISQVLEMVDIAMGKITSLQ